MSCCGHRPVSLSTGLSTGLLPRRTLAGAAPSAPSTAPTTAPTPSGSAQGRRLGFEWQAAPGAAALTVTGRASGRVYRFEQMGQRLTIDARDWQQMFTVPALRWVGDSG